MQKIAFPHLQTPAGDDILPMRQLIYGWRNEYEKQIIGVLFLCFSVLYAGEANPQFFTFTIKNRILTGTQFESARTPVVKTVLQKDIFIVDLKTEFLGEENINLPIPQSAKK